MNVLLGVELFVTEIQTQALSMRFAINFSFNSTTNMKKGSLL
jgi:hypothetical protein